MKFSILRCGPQRGPIELLSFLGFPSIFVSWISKCKRESTFLTLQYVYPPEAGTPLGGPQWGTNLLSFFFEFFSYRPILYPSKGGTIFGAPLRDPKLGQFLLYSVLQLSANKIIVVG